MGAVCSSPAEQAVVFDPRGFILIADHEAEIAKSSEQKNLLRFKVEVLINMLAIEEKKMESLTKRIEVLKWAMLSRGITEDGLDGMLKSIPDAMVSNETGLSSPQTKSINTPVDLGGAIERLAEEFATNKRDIVQCFADEEGKVVTSLSRDEFMRQLYAATEHVSKADIHAISLRFFDGSTVSIVEFIEFFMTPNAVRQAKSAASAVRMSLDLFQLEQNTEDRRDSFIDDPNDDDENQLVLSSSHVTGTLDKGTSSLSLMWEVVEADLVNYFEGQEDLGDSIVLLQTFKKILTDVCGVKSKVLRAFLSTTPNSQLQPLQQDEVEMLAERFEIGGRVHYGHFLHIFREMKELGQKNNRKAKSYKAIDGSVQMQSARSKPSVGISPFRMSSEWAALKAEAVKGNEMDKRREKERGKESEKERIRDIKNSKNISDTPNNHLSLLNADSKSDKPPRRDTSDRTLGADSRNLGGGSGPNGARSGRDDKSEDMGGSGGRPSPGSGGQMRSMMNDGNAMQTSGNTTFPESKVVYSGANTPPPKPVRSVLGQYEANMASAGKTDKMDGRGNDDDDDNARSERKSDYLDSSKSSNKSRKNDRNNTSANINQRSNNDSGREPDTGRDRHFSMSNPNKSSTRSRSKGRRYNNNNNDDENDDYKDDGTNYPNSHNARNDEGNVTPENIPQNVPGNRMSWGKSLFGRRKSKGPEDPSVKRGSLTVPHPAHSPVEKATRFMPTWMRSGDSGSSSPVAL